MNRTALPRVLLWVLALLTNLAFRPVSDEPVLAATGWKRLASFRVDYTQNPATIEIDSRNRAYSALRLRVRRADLVVPKIAVYYENGGVDQFDVRHSFQKEQGSDFLVVDLPGAPRRLQRVVLWYDAPRTAKENAVIQVWGKRAKKTGDQ
jgi:hypothetical protein